MGSLRCLKRSKFFSLYLTAAVAGMFLFQAIEPLRALDFEGTSPLGEAAVYRAAVNAVEVSSEGKLLQNPAQRPNFQSKPLPRHIAFSLRSALRLEYGGASLPTKHAPCRVEQKNRVSVKLLN